MSEDQEAALYEAFLIESREIGLIAPARDGRPCVEFRFGGGWRECRIWQGYLDASHILLREALRETPRCDNLIFPALFSLRHAMEVALKWHIRYAGGAIPRSAGHDLVALIEEFRRTADDLDDDASYIADGMLDCVSELASIDPRSTAFRYSTQFDGTPIEIIPERWDLNHLYFAVQEILMWFDGLSNQIDLSRDERYQAYLRSE